MKITKATAYALHALMYMARHITQLPATSSTIAKAEGIPPRYLAKIFQTLVNHHFVRAVKGKKKGYVFATPPEQISLLKLFEAIEGGPLFDDCLLKHCECGGTPENCCIFATWLAATRKIAELLDKTSLVTAAWQHPEHRFYSLPKSLEAAKHKTKSKVTT